MIFKNRVLKLFYRALITGLPLTTYNSFSDVSFHAPEQIEKYSSYVNYKLTKYQYDYLNTHLLKTTNNLNLKKISISENESTDNYYLSINMYNCTSPMFSLVSKEPITRCEINTYITNEKNEFGTLIMDYCSNFLSIDPDNIFKLPSETIFKLNKTNIFKAKNKDFSFFLNYTLSPNDKDFFINKQLVEFTDKIFYNNGLYDKLFYDTSLTLANTKIPLIHNVSFKFHNLTFTNPESIFYFTNKLNFVCAMWNNLENFSWF